MKNVLFILVFSWLFIACDNQQDEIHRSDELNKESVIKTRVGYNDTIVFPYISHHMDCREREIYLNVGRPTEKEYKEMCYKYPEISTYPPNWSECYVQYRTENMGRFTDSEWYYYNPDTVRCKSPFKVKLDHNCNVVLKASKFPSAEFQHRVQLIGRGVDYINYVTEPQEMGVYSLETLSRNSWGFTENNGNQGGSAGSVELISIKLIFEVELHLDARGAEGFTYVLKFENQESPEFRVYYNETATYYYTFEKNELLRNVPINSTQSYTVHFDGKEYNIQYYIDPNNIQRVYNLHYFKDVYISSYDLKYK